ncbi:hypothetical protein HY492_02255 [Candidatus Woesearchaeota archaeon]|nr:hypothetical protein [Candidatus Woesearchaeota archaeon]
MKRFYNIKQGKPNVMGALIEIDLDKPLEERVYFATDIAEEKGSTISLTKKGKFAVYAVCEPNGEFKDVAKKPVWTPEGDPTRYQIKVAADGTMQLVEGSSRTKLYLSELTAKQAKEKRDEAVRWAMQRDYFW